MGRNFQRRDRMESLGPQNSSTLAALGDRDINFEKFDEEIIFDDINKRLDIQEKKLPLS